MSILHRYLLRQNLLYLGICLLTCVGIYLLIDVFDRMDDFLEEGARVQSIFVYFLSKIPLIISQILPAVFLLAIVVQVSLMRREREITALESGGIAFHKIVLFFVFYALIWSFFQLFFSQLLGVQGMRKSEAIWNHLGQKQKQSELENISNVWFRNNRYMVHIGKAVVGLNKGQNLKVFFLSDDFAKIKKIYLAEHFQVDPQSWKLKDVQIFDPQQFSFSQHKQKALTITQKLETFLTVQSEDSPEKMPIWKLGEVINRLQATGSKVAGLETAWHMKISYAFSLFIVTIIGLLLTRYWSNIFLNISAAVILVFLYYCLYVLGESMGQKGILWPWLGAWMANLLMGVPAFVLLLWCLRPAGR